MPHCPPTLRLSTVAALLLASQLATAAENLERVEITGSAIKRPAADGALPVQTITREDIAKAGVTTASELLAQLSASSGGLSDGASINVGGYDQKGFNSANLRGLGTSSTLVLLNGRRMANFASPGDDAGVDLNNIPAAAIERVEVLLDGASAIYGADAIAGVINFITRKDFQGLELNSQIGKTREGGAGKRTASIAAGFGDIVRDGFNVFGVLDAQRTERLSTSQREFIAGLKVPERLGHLLSGFTSPANIRLSSAQRDHLQDRGFTIKGKPIVNRTINLSAPDCAPPANLYLPAGTGGEDACTYDYMRDTELYPKSEKLGFLGRGVLQLTPAHQLFAELALTRARTWYVGSSARVTGYMDYRLVPELAGTALETIDEEYPGELQLQMRLDEAGRRSSQLTSEGRRFVTGLSGMLAGWDYELALNRSVNTVRDRDTHGYVLYNELMAGINSGLINPFGPSSAAGKALIDSIQVDDEVRFARGTMDALDLKASRALSRLAGGELMLALGGELRREKSHFRPSALLLSDNINNDFAPEGGGPTTDSRKVRAVYAELLAPFAPQWEAQLALRHDHYQGIGGASSPKLGLRYTPSKALLLRGSLGAGFRAPSMNDLYRPTVYSSTATLPDPVSCAANDNDLSVCADNWNTRRYSNPNLKPERSRQASLGLVFEADHHWTLSADWWTIKRSKLISEIGDDVILGNLAKYGDLVYRDEDGDIDYIELRKDNRGAQKASGLDLVLDLHGVKTGWGQFGARLSGTLMLDSKLQTAPGDPYISNLGRFVTEGAVQRWRHRLSLDWERGPFSLTLGNTFYSSYQDQNSAINIDDGSIVAANRVKAYSLWDSSLAWRASPALSLRVGVQNLFDKSPPFSNQAYHFLSGYDPSYTDPRGRYLYVNLNYAMK